MSSRTDACEDPAGFRWGAAFFALLALTPVTPYIKISAVGLAVNDFPPILAVLCGILALAARYRHGEPLPVAFVALFSAEIALIAAASAVDNGLLFKDVLAGPIRWIETTLIIGLAYILGSDRRLRSMFLKLAVLLAAASALFGIGAFAAGWVGPNYLGIEPFSSYQVLYGVFPGRITGTLGIPSNGSGVLFGLALPIAVGYAIGAKDRVSRFRWLVVVATLAVALMFTFSRVPLVIGVGMVVVLLAIRLRPSVALSAAAAFALIVVASPLRERFAGDHNDRLALWSAAVSMTRDHLLLGVGPDQYNDYLFQYSVTPFGIAVTTAHNSVLEAAATMGIFAALLITLAIGGSLVWLPRAWRLRRSSPEVFGAWLGLFGFVAASMTVNFFFWPQLGLLYWVMSQALARTPAPAPQIELAEQPAVPVQDRRALAAPVP